MTSKNSEMINFIDRTIEELIVNNITPFVRIQRWDKDNPYWNVFISSKDKDKTYCYGNHSLEIMGIQDMIYLLDYLSEKEINIYVDIKKYFGKSESLL